MGKVALVTGVTGQDGAYLSKLLLEKGYEVAGTYRRTSSPNTWRLDRLGITEKVHLVPMDMTEQGNIWRVLQATQPDEIYNLAAQSFVAMSFEQPVYTGEVDAIGVLRLLDATRQLCPHARFYQASTSEMFGNSPAPQNEQTRFAPRSPYGCAKLYAHSIVTNYREAYDLFACSGILFNHESPLRGLEFVTRKIVNRIATQKFPIPLGNTAAKRDWGFAGDYVEGMWMMLNAAQPNDYVLATGTTSKVQSFASLVAKHFEIDLEWRGSYGVNTKTGEMVFYEDPELMRPAEVYVLCGDASKARKELGWEAKTTLPELVRLMCDAEIASLNA